MFQLINSLVSVIAIIYRLIISKVTIGHFFFKGIALTVLKSSVNSKYSKFLEYSIYVALLSYAAGLITSISILSLAHIALIFPCIYLAFHTKWSEMPKSAWGLFAFTIVVIISVFLNFEIMKNGFKPALKAKYFLYGFVSIVPFFYFLNEKLTQRRKQVLIGVIFTTTIIALIGGTIARKTGYNPITNRYVEMHLDRNSGVMGFVLNYAHNLAYFMTIFVTLLIAYWKDTTRRERIIYGIVLSLNIYALYTTYARGALLALIIGITGYFLKDIKRLAVTFLIVIVLGVIGYFGNYQSFKREGSDTLRLSMWETALVAYKERPVFGWGYLNFEQHSRDIKIRHNIVHQEFGGHAHNSILEVMATTGTVGLIAFLAWIGFWVRELIMRTDKLAQVELAALCAVFVGGLTQSTIGLGINLFFIMLIYSLSAANTLKTRSLK